MSREQNGVRAGEGYTQLPVGGVTIAVDTDALQAAVNTGTIDYSLEEQWTGKHWLDGRKLYEKTIDCKDMPLNALKRVPHQIDQIGNIVNIFGRAYDVMDFPTAYALPNGGNTDTSVSLSCSAREVVIQTTSNAWADRFAHVTIQYTRSDR